MKMTQIMSKALKGILLYSTILYFFCFITAAESLALASISYIIIGLFIFIILVGANILTFKNENLEDFIPKFLK